MRFATEVQAPWRHPTDRVAASIRGRAVPQGWASQSRNATHLIAPVTSPPIGRRGEEPASCAFQLVASRTTSFTSFPSACPRSACAARGMTFLKSRPDSAMIESTAARISSRVSIFGR